MNDSRPSRYEPFFSASRSGDIGRDVRSCEVLWLPRNLRSNRDMRLQQEGRVRFLGLPEARFDPFPYCLVPRGNEGRFLELSDLFVVELAELPRRWVEEPPKLEPGVA